MVSEARVFFEDGPGVAIFSWGPRAFDGARVYGDGRFFDDEGVEVGGECDLEAKVGEFSCGDDEEAFRVDVLVFCDFANVGTPVRNADVAEVCHVSRMWVHKFVATFEELGADGRFPSVVVEISPLSEVAALGVRKDGAEVFQARGADRLDFINLLQGLLAARCAGLRFLDWQGLRGAFEVWLNVGPLPETKIGFRVAEAIHALVVVGPDFRIEEEDDRLNSATFWAC